MRLGLNAPCYKPYEYDYKMYDDAPLVLTADLTTQETLETGVEFKIRIDENGHVRVKTKSEYGKQKFVFSLCRPKYVCRREVLLWHTVQNR